MRVLSKVYLLLILMLILSACGGDEPDNQDNQPIADLNGPDVTLLSPSAGEIVVLDQAVEIISEGKDARGIARIELLINGEVIRVDANPDPMENAAYKVAQLWSPRESGSYTIQIRAYNTANVMGQSDILTVQALERTATPTPNPDFPTELPATVAPLSVTTATPTSSMALAGGPETTPTALPPTSTPTSGKLVEPTPVPIPTRATFAPTGFEAQGRFGEIWLELGGTESLLGYPTSSEVPDRDFAEQYFERGLMFWWDSPGDPDFIWAIASSETDFMQGPAWQRFNDTWDGNNEYSCEAAKPEDFGPRRGFGKVWCENEEVINRLGKPIQAEMGSAGNAPFSIVQFYQGGVMLYNPLRSEVFVLFERGGWQRFLY